MIDPSRIPVIIGVGEVRDLPVSLESALEPLALMELALRQAAVESSEDLVGQIDALDVINLISWPYEAPARMLAECLRISPAHLRYGPVGGETPLRYIQEAAVRIASGQSQVAAVCGGEAHLSAARAVASGTELSWTAKPVIAAPSVRGQDTAHPLAKAIGAHLPVTVYPFYEVAGASALGQSPEQALDESAALWAKMSEVAASNPYAWYDHPVSAADIAAAGPENRMIAWPYRKLMVANIAVNMGAAIIVTSLAKARSLGLDDGRLAFVQGGFLTEEPFDYLTRDSFEHCVARNVILEATMAKAENGFDHYELYSCFPCVPKAARRTLGLPHEHPCTVNGGLTFAGAPLNNYMGHATAAMVRTLKDRPGTGLLYGQGGFMTKHATLVLSSAPPQTDWLGDPPSLQDQVSANYGDVPRFDDQPQGLARLETYTITYDREGRKQGVAVARLEGSGDRTLAVAHPDELSVLEDNSSFVVGAAGTVSTPGDGLPKWSFK